ncbi:MAG: FtsK/SpoIIIE domain-containing protein [Acidimicrobiales bacterium]
MHIRVGGEDRVVEAPGPVDAEAIRAALSLDWGAAGLRRSSPASAAWLRRGDDLSQEAGDGTGGGAGLAAARPRQGLWSRRPDERGRLVVQRSQPPAVTAPTTIAPVTVIVDDEPMPPLAVPWAGIVPSVVAGGVMAMFFSPPMAVMAGVSAVAMVGRSVGSQVRFRRQSKRRAAQLVQFDEAKGAAIRAWQQAEVARRQADEIGPTRLLGAVADGSFHPWTTRDVATLGVGVGRVDDRVDGSVVGDDAQMTIELDDVPLEVGISAGCGLALCGDREPQLRAGRWVVCSQSASVGPADLNLILLVAPDRLIDWDWAKWLPSRPTVATNHDEIETALQSQGPADCSLIVVDGVEPVGGGEFGAMLSGRVTSCRLLWIGAPGEVPAGCATVVTPYPDRSMRVERSDGTSWCGRANGLSAEEALAVALALAPLDDPEMADARGDVPANVMLGDLVGVGSEVDWADAVDRRWPTSRRQRLAVEVGCDEVGPYVLDLVEDGPHMLVAGTTGAGKSEFLRTLVAGLAVSHPPQQVTFVLIDFKGGGAFDVVSDLPHVAAVVTDLDPAESERALRSLRAELHSREVLLRENQASSIDELADDVPLARLLVVVDEFAALADELPAFLDGLVDIARRGRSLGVHLVLATQRPAGVVTGQIRANTALRVCLRVQEKADSADVIDVASGATLPPIAGRALIRRQGAIREVQVARIGHVAGGIMLRPFVIHPLLLPNMATADDRTVLRLDALITATNERSDGYVVQSPWAPRYLRSPTGGPPLRRWTRPTDRRAQSGSVGWMTPTIVAIARLRGDQPVGGYS